MSTYDLEQTQLDAMNAEMRSASILQTVGWVLLGFNAIPACLIFVGFRSGSYFWLYWMLVEGAIGFGLVMVGAYLRANAGRYISRLGYEREENKAA
jgi:hypothetical protein